MTTQPNSPTTQRVLLFDVPEHLVGYLGVPRPREHVQLASTWQQAVHFLANVQREARRLDLIVLPWAAPMRAGEQNELALVFTRPCREEHSSALIIVVHPYGDNATGMISVPGADEVMSHGQLREALPWLLGAVLAD